MRLLEIEITPEPDSPLTWMTALTKIGEEVLIFLKEEGEFKWGVDRSPDGTWVAGKYTVKWHDPAMTRDSALQLNYEEMREVEGEWAQALDEIASGLPGYEKPSHDPNCASCTIGNAIRTLARFRLGPDHRLSEPLPEVKLR
jgi:hypothetical protein